MIEIVYRYQMLSPINIIKIKLWKSNSNYTFLNSC